MQTGENQILLQLCPETAAEGQREELPKCIASHSPHTDVPSFQVLKETGRERGGRRKDLSLRSVGLSDLNL